MATITTPSFESAEEAASKAMHKRYEGLIMVRDKAIKGKGAWYWAHFEPLLIYNTETGHPKAVKLRCSLCDTVFSASNPSRTASEHFKRGTCPNFNKNNIVAKPICSVSPTSASASVVVAHHKRSSSYNVSSSLVDPPYHVSTSVVDLVSQQQQHLMLSGGKEDLGALSMLEDSVKKLKSPKLSSTGSILNNTQINRAFDFLADWVFEFYGSVSFSSLEHSKFKAFLQQVGLPPISAREFIGTRLDAKFEEAKVESEARIRDAMFFQISSDGWKQKSNSTYRGEENLVNVSVNLPNGTSLYKRAMFITGSVPSTYAEEILWETVTGICGNIVQQCVGIVSDRFKAKALKNLEEQNHWMVNLLCQYQGFNSLIKDFSKELPLFKNVARNCLKLANFMNYKSQVRNCFRKFQLQEYRHAWLLRMPLGVFEDCNFEAIFQLVEDILSSVRALQLVVLDESFKMVCIEDPNAREVGDMIRDIGFWNDLEAMHTLVKLVKDMAREIENERPLVGQCLPLWDELRAKVKNWCAKFHIAEEPLVEKLIEKRFKKNYHPAWAAAYILDPRYLVRDTSGRYLPPFNYLTPEQEKDVDKLITRLVSRDEAHIALMELMKWRSEGLDPVYAQAVQMKERDPVTGKMRIVNPQSSRLVWETYLTEFKSLGKVAVRLIFLRATSCGFECDRSLWRYLCAHGHSRTAQEKVQKLIFIAASSKLERNFFSSEEELFSLENGEDNVLNV